MSVGGALVALSAGSGPGPSHWPAQRAPLPQPPVSRPSQPNAPEAGCWAGTLPYVATLPGPLPAPGTPEARYVLRGNFQLQIPGLTSGFNASDRSLLMTWFLPALSTADQRLSVDWYANGCGYKDLVLSIPQTKNIGKGLGDLLASCLLAQSYGLRIVLNVMGGDREDFDTDVKPWLDALYAAGIRPILCVAWQIDAPDKFAADGRPYTQALVDITLQVSTWADGKDLDLAQHWENDACALWPYPEHGIANRMDYGRFMAGIVKFQLFQCFTEADIGSVQEGIAKVMQGHPEETLIVPTEYETDAIANDPQHRLELYGDQKGYYCLCVAAYGHRSAGLLGGGRLPSGMSF